MTRLQLHFFGPMQAEIGAIPLHFATAKVVALLAYLAIEPERPYRREQLAALLWPDLPDADARRNLRLTLHRLKQSVAAVDPDLADALLRADRSTVQWHAAAADVDVTRFLDLLAAAETHDHPRLDVCDRCRETLTTAAALLQGELLAGFGLDDSLPFDEWLVIQREFFHHRALRLLSTLADIAERRGAYDEAFAFAQRQLALEPWHEAAHRQAMRALGLGGDRDRALAQYETCRTVLAEELGVEPAPETTTLYQRIRDNRFDSRPASLPLHHLPADLTPFIGRDDELARITTVLQGEAARLLTLIGPGGSGKTRLAVQAARQVAASAPDDCDAVYFVALAAAEGRQTAVTTLAARLNVSLSGADDPLQEVLQHLKPQNWLLLLDNLEQLDGAAGLVAAILQAAPAVRILATSREPLGLQGEQRLPVGGLPYPSVGAEEVQRSPAVALFVQSARQMSPGFRLDETAAAAVVELCHLVDGLPLGLELAAGWVRLMDCPAIVHEAKKNLAFLATDLQNVPPRHRSLNVIFHQTWGMLSAQLQTVLAQAALFPADFTLSALQGIVPGASILDLATLLDKSLLRRSAANHYELHPLLKQFVRRESPPPTGAERRFAQFYLQDAAQREEALYGRTPQQAARHIRRELINLRQAWLWGGAHKLWPEMAAALPALRRFYQMEGLFAEAVDGLNEALDAVADLPEAELFVVALRLDLSFFLGQQGRYDPAIRQAQAALQLAARRESPQLAAVAHASIGEWRRHQGQFEAAAARLQQALERFSPASSPAKAAAFNELGFCHMGRGQYPAARRAFQEALAIFEERDDPSGTAVTLGNLGYVAQRQGSYDDAREYLQRALGMAREINDRQSIVKHTLGLGWVALQRGKMEVAQQLQQEALALSEEIGYLRGALTAYRHIADTSLYQNRLDDAEKAYHRLLQRSEQAQLNDLAAHAIGNLGIVCSRRGDYDAAVAQYEKAIALCRRLDDPVNLRKHLGNLGSTYRRRQQFSAAAQCFREALRIERQVGVRHGEANTLINLGALSRQQGDLDNAQLYFERALAIHTELVHPDGVAKSEGYLGILHQQRGEFTEARRRLGAALQISEEMGDALTAAVWRQNLAETELELGAGETAVTHIAAALDTFRRLQSRAYLASALVGRAEIYRRQGRPGAALLAADEAAQVAEAVPDEQKLFEARLLLAQLQMENGEQEAAITRLQTLLAAAELPERQAALHDALWQAGAGEEHGAAALKLYRQLLEKTPEFRRRRRAAVLAAAVGGAAA